MKKVLAFSVRKIYISRKKNIFWKSLLKSDLCYFCHILYISRGQYHMLVLRDPLVYHAALLTSCHSLWLLSFLLDILNLFFWFVSGLRSYLTNYILLIKDWHNIVDSSFIVSSITKRFVGRRVWLTWLTDSFLFWFPCRHFLRGQGYSTTTHLSECWFDFIHNKTKTYAVIIIHIVIKYVSYHILLENPSRPTNCAKKWGKLERNTMNN